MALRFSERLLTVAVTATLTSAGWIVFGGTIMGGGGFAVVADEEVSQPLHRVPTTDEEAEFVPSRGEENAPGLAPEAGEDQDLAIPVVDVRRADLIDSFSDERVDGSRTHEAIDIMAPEGAEVVAAAPGVIERLFVSNAGGNTIYVRSPDRRTIYYYAHLNAYAPELREGQQVLRGERLGTVGTSGNAPDDAPHLHFAVLRTTEDANWWEPAAAVNPFPLLRQ